MTQTFDMVVCQFGGKMIPTINTRWRLHYKEHSMVFFALFCSVFILLTDPVRCQDEEFPCPTPINHLLVDEDSQSVYVAAVNKLFRLDSNLQEQSRVETGPQLDQIGCFNGGFEDDRSQCILGGVYVTTEYLDNENRILTKSDTHGKIIACGSRHVGACTMYDMDLSNNKTYNNNPSQNMGGAFASSTVGLVAPGPASTGSAPDGECLYVGIVLPTLYKDGFVGTSAISSRIIHLTDERTAFTLVEDDYMDAGTETGTFEKFSAEHENYDITYKGIFSSAGFTYFYSTQLFEQNYESKLLRVCQMDEVYSPIVEIPIKCGSDTTLIEAVTVVPASARLAAQIGSAEGDSLLVASFSKPSRADSNERGDGFAICLYKMSDVRHLFTVATKNCYAGNGDLLKQYYNPAGDEKCHAGIINQTRVDDTFCSNKEYPERNKAIDGRTFSADGRVLISGSGYVTSIKATNINDYLVLFYGTSAGNLEASVVKRVSDTVQFSSRLIEANEPLLQDMFFNNDMASIYLGTQNKVRKVSLASDCDKYKTCASCIAANDPYCGWCSLEKRCTMKTSCGHYEDENRWLLFSDRCIAITSYSHNSSDVNAPSPVSIGIQLLPLSRNEQYLCLLDDMVVSSMMTGAAVITCDLASIPKEDIIFPENADNRRYNLSVQSVETGVSFQSTSYTIYNCNYHTSCHSCTGASGALWGCKWCVHDNVCSHDSNHRQCSNSRIIATEPLECPSIDHSSDINIQMPVNYPQTIRIPGRNLPEPLSGQTGYTCLVNTVSPPVRVPAVMNNRNEIICEERSYDYTANSLEASFEVQVVWNEDYFIEDLDPVMITFYKCGFVKDCSLCQSLLNSHPTYNCLWCKGSCQYGPIDTCGQSSSSECPQPYIDRITPAYGPTEGGTKLTIYGSNLGTSYSNVASAVSINDKQCFVLQSEYDVARKIVCRTPSSETESEFRVKVDLGSSVWSTTQFSYRNPEVISLEPLQGPISGGTLMTIFGKKLNIGSMITVQMGENECTEPMAINAEQVECLSPAVDSPQTMSGLTVRIDNAVMTLNSATFQYAANPNISEIYPLDVWEGGGRMITVTGSNFQFVQKPEIVLKSGNYLSPSSLCTVPPSEFGDTMYCPAPPYVMSLAAGRRRREISPNDLVFFGFIFDGYDQLLDLSDAIIEAEATVTATPEYFLFEGGKEIYRGDYLVLAGRNLESSCTPEDVRVTIGSELCIVDSLSSNKLLCTPPLEQPGGIDKNGEPDKDILPIVTVYLGSGYLNTTLGQLEYEQPGETFPNWAFIAIGGVAGLLFLIIMIILVRYRRRSKLAERKVKKMLIQLESLESNVRNECKQAFAELQTEVSDLTSDINVTGIPFWDYQTYTFKVLFPSHTDHPILHMNQEISQFQPFPMKYAGTFQRSLNRSMTRLGTIDQGHHQWNQLLNSKQFLIIFIRTLEQQKTFSMRDRAVVASLLMVVLQDKMDYATEILKALLMDLIDRSVEKKNPKLLFRRTESVVEKFLTNWLSLSLYDHMKKQAGRPLFLLYKAIKHQIEKGPVDAISHEARYSLSEDRLLREKIEFKTLTIHLSKEGQESVICKMLDCDTVTQALEKALDAIYKNTPASHRPSVHDVDLRWNSGRSAFIHLADDDVTTNPERGWKAVNTLGHYRVPDGAYMELVAKRDKSDGVRHIHGMVEITSGSSLTALTPIVTIDEGMKVWHLVKQDETSQYHRTEKVISEIFLTRLLTTKGTLQQYIDDLLLTILHVDINLPPAIKYLFDFLDQAAQRHNIQDPEVVHTWKSNSFTLRFWVNILKNPEFVFDINKSITSDACWSVIAQTFMDACSMSEQKLGKDSPTNKLLFARDIPKYRRWVETFYRQVSEMPPVKDQDMNVAMTEISMHYVCNFNISVALKELYRYANQYNYELLEALDEDPTAKKLHLADKFEQMTASMEGPNF